MTIVLFDFDGTLADTLPTVLAIANRLAPEFGYPPTGATEWKQLRSLSSREILRSKRMPRWKLPWVLRRLSQELRSELPRLTWIPGIEPVLQQLVAEGHSLGIVTSNANPTVAAFLAHQGGALPFRVMQTGVGILGKARVLGRVVWWQGWDPRSVLYVGDEVRDVEAARRAGLRSVAVTWGFNTATALAAAQPDYLIHDPRSLLTLVSPPVGEIWGGW